MKRPFLCRLGAKGDSLPRQNLAKFILTVEISSCKSFPVNESQRLIGDLGALRFSWTSAVSAEDRHPREWKLRVGVEVIRTLITGFVGGGLRAKWDNQWPYCFKSFAQEIVCKQPSPCMEWLWQDQESVFNARSAGLYSRSPDDRKADRQRILSTVSKNWRALLWASDDIRGDWEIVLNAVSQNWQSLRWASDDLKGDREIVLNAVSQRWQSLEWASDDLKADRHIIMNAVSQGWQALQWASDDLKGDREIVLKAVSKNWQSLQWASKDLKRDREIVFEGPVTLMGSSAVGLKRSQGIPRDYLEGCVTALGGSAVGLRLSQGRQRGCLDSRVTVLASSEVGLRWSQARTRGCLECRVTALGGSGVGLRRSQGRPRGCLECSVTVLGSSEVGLRWSQRRQRDCLERCVAELAGTTVGLIRALWGSRNSGTHIRNRVWGLCFSVEGLTPLGAFLHVSGSCTYRSEEEYGEFAGNLYCRTWSREAAGHTLWQAGTPRWGRGNRNNSQTQWVAAREDASCDSSCGLWSPATAATIAWSSFTRWRRIQNNQYTTTMWELRDRSAA